MAKQDWVIVSIIFFLTLSIAVFYLKFMPISPLTGDSLEYDLIAQNLSQGKGYSLRDSMPTAARPPLYPFFLAFIYTFFGHSYAIVRIIQFMLLGLIGVFVYFIGKNQLSLSPLFAFLASVTVVFWPYFALYSTLVLTEILFTFVLLITVFILLYFHQEGSIAYSVLLGVLLGAAALVRQVVLFLPLWIMSFFLVFMKSTRRQPYRFRLFLVLLVFILTILPWTARNYLHFNQILPITSVTTPVFEKAYVTLDYTEGSVPLKPGEAGLKTIILSRLQNIALFWNPGAEGENARTVVAKYPFAKYLFSGYKIVFFIILGLAFFSLKFIKKKKILLLWSIILYFWAIHTLLFPYPRYTLPIIPLVVLLCFYSINYLSSRDNLKHILH